jgi:hypothetical protein
MNFNFLTGKKDPYLGMLPGQDATDIAQLAGSGASNQMIANAQMGGMRNYAPVDKIVPNTQAMPSPASSGMSMGDMGQGLAALGSALGGGQEQQIQPASFAPVPMPQQTALPNLTPQLAQFDFADYLRKRQAGLL